MKSNIFILIWCGWLLPSTIYAQPMVKNIDNVNDSSFCQYMDSLTSVGNHAYELSNRIKIQSVIQLMEKSLEQKHLAGHLLKQDSLNYTADILKLKGDYHYENSNYNTVSYKLACQYFDSALTIYQNNSQVYQSRIVTILHIEKAQLFYKQRQYRNALAEMLKVDSLYQINLDNYEIDPYDAEYLDFLTQYAMCLMRTGNYEDAYSKIEKALSSYSDKSNIRYFEALRKKAKIIMVSGTSKRKNEALACYKEYYEHQKAYCKHMFNSMTAEEREQYWMRIRPFITDCYYLEDVDASFLYDVTLFSKGLLLQLNRFSGQGVASAKALASLDYTWCDIQKKLNSDACAIEYIQYETDEITRMAALVLRSSGTPQFIKMSNPSEILNYKFENVGDNVSERINSTSRKRKNGLYRDSVLCSMIWSQTLLHAIDNCKSVYFSPDGYLHRLAIEYMIPQSSSPKKLFRLSSTRQLVEKRDRISSQDSALICGGIDYNSELENSVISCKNDSIAYAYYHNEKAYFSQLPASEQEARNIKDSRACNTDSMLTGSSAHEYAFRNLCSQFPLVSIYSN